MLEAAIVWLLLAVMFLILELTVSAYMLPFAVGSLAGLLSAAFGAPVPMQVIIFALVSLIAFLVLKPGGKNPGSGDDPIDPEG